MVDPPTIQIRMPTGNCHINAAAAENCGLDSAHLGEQIGTIVGARAMGGILKIDSRSVVHRVECHGNAWVVKGYHLGRWKAQLYSLLRQSPAWRELRAAARLHAAGVRVVQPVALMSHDPIREADELLILPFIDAPNFAQFLASQPPREQWTATDFQMRRNIAAAIGTQIRQMISAGLINRDHKAANLLIDAACRSGEAPPWLIDTGGLRPYREPEQLRRVLHLLFKTARSAGTWLKEEEAACHAAATGTKLPASAEA